MKIVLKLVFGLLAAAGAANAQNACLIEGQVMGEAVKDCTQTSLPIPSTQFSAQCKEGATGPLRATPLKACPAKAQAVCVNPYGIKTSIYYYARSPKSLEDTKKSCLAQKGAWQDRPN